MNLARRLAHVFVGFVIALSLPVFGHKNHETPRCPDQPNPRSGPKKVAKYIRCVARHVPGFEAQKAIEVGSCESGLDPKATNGPHRGIFQHNVRYWPGRARDRGWAGHSAYEPAANIWVTAHMVREQGWSKHWTCA